MGSVWLPDGMAVSLLAIICEGSTLLSLGYERDIVFRGMTGLQGVRRFRLKGNIRAA